MDRRDRKREPVQIDERNKSRGRRRDSAKERNRSRSPLDDTSLDIPVKQKEEPNYNPSNILRHQYDSKSKIRLKHVEPPEARTPKNPFYLFIYKKEELLQKLRLEKSCYLVGREDICDLKLEHLSISRQHACFQYRDKGKGIKLYIMDLESSHGVYLNGEKLEHSRFYEIRSRDLVKFGESTREFVVIQDDQS
jgi:smad nuclear-interacting protein 1